MATFREAGESGYAFCETMHCCLRYHSSIEQWIVKHFPIAKRQDLNVDPSPLERARKNRDGRPLKSDGRMKLTKWQVDSAARRGLLHISHLREKER